MILKLLRTSSVKRRLDKTFLKELCKGIPSTLEVRNEDYTEILKFRRTLIGNVRIIHRSERHP